MIAAAKEYGPRDLVMALLVAREDRNAHTDLIKYSASRYLAMGRALGLREEELPPIEGEDPYGGDELAGLFESALTSYQRIQSPFASYLEASEQIIRLYRHHGPRLAESVEAAQIPIVDLLVDLVTLRWGLPPATRITDEDLRSHGFDPDAPAPDPVDYL